MEKEKRFRVEDSDLPELLRGFSVLLINAQHGGIDAQDDQLFAISCFLDYIANDLQDVVDEKFQAECELYRLKKKSTVA